MKTKCLSCGNLFKQTERPQGGGQHKLYCHIRCKGVAQNMKRREYGR